MRFLMIALCSLPFIAAQAADALPPVDKNDAEFVRKAATAGMMEIHTSELALRRGLSADERKFAQQMIDDHTKVNKELATLAEKKGIAVPKAIDQDGQAKVDKLAKVEEKKFAEEYLECQVKDHKDAVSLFEDESKDGKDPELRAFAATHLPHLKGHLDTAKQLEAKR
jgi:putative membrane protein